MSGILERLADGMPVGVAELAKEFKVATATIRRDLALLEEQRLLVRTHGGAVAQAVSYELPLRYKGVRHSEEKRRIAREAALLVRDGMAVGLTGGTTTTEVARALADRQDLTIVTNALNIAAELAVRPNLKLVVTGGVARSNSYELSGPIAEATLALLNLDLVFAGVDGISVRAGCTTHQDVEAHSNAVMIGRSSRVVVVADSSKIGHVAFARICELSEIDELVTDTSTHPGPVHELEAAGLHVRLV
jgi:DeoR family transcriptional regulator of aga operon